MTVQGAYELGFRIRRRGAGIYLRTPWSNWLICPSYAVAWRTLVRLCA